MRSRKEVPDENLIRIKNRMIQLIGRPEGMQLPEAIQVIVNDTNLPRSEADRLADTIIQKWRRYKLICPHRDGKIRSWRLEDGISLKRLG